MSEGRALASKLRSRYPDNVRVLVGGATSCAWLGCATGSPAPDDRDSLPNPTTLVEDCLDPNRALGIAPDLVAHLGRPVCGWHPDQDL